MADVGENTTYTDAVTAISQGKRHLLVQDYTAAVTALAAGLEMMSQKLDDCNDELGEPYLLYGRALLGLAREEVGVLGEGVPGSDEAEDDDDDDEDEDEDEEEEEDEDNEKKTSDNESKDEEDEEAAKMETSESPMRNDSSANDEKTTTRRRKNKKKEETADVTSEEAKKDPASNKTDDRKIEENKIEKTNDKTPSVGEKAAGAASVSGTSKESSKNGPETALTKNSNGTAGKSTENMANEDKSDEDANKEDEEEEDPGRGIDLQVAWEVLELAKIVFTKRGEIGARHLAETHRLLGEVAMESDNPRGAIVDLEKSLELLEKLEPAEPRAMADINYQLGLAHSLANDFDSAIKQFGIATSLLEARIKELGENGEQTAADRSRDDPFYTIAGEIKELSELLPAIKEKIIDMKDFKEEACRLVIEGIKNNVSRTGRANGAGTSNDDGQSSSSSSSSTNQRSSVCPKIVKPASDISHLVRKKRKNEDEAEERSPCKKPTP